MVRLTPADVSDSAGAQAIIDAIRKRWPWLKHPFADGAYDRIQLIDKAAFRDFVIEVVRRIEPQATPAGRYKEPGFRVLPRRRVVECGFAWIARWRRLVLDYERRLDVAEAFIHVAVGSLRLRRPCHCVHSRTDSELDFGRLSCIARGVDQAVDGGAGHFDAIWCVRGGVELLAGAKLAADSGEGIAEGWQRFRIPACGARH